METLTFEEWKEKYKPINEEGFETYGDDADFINDTDFHRVWTEVDGSECSAICVGWRYVNRIRYFVTLIPWKENDDDWVKTGQ